MEIKSRSMQLFLGHPDSGGRTRYVKYAELIGDDIVIRLGEVPFPVSDDLVEAVKCILNDCDDVPRYRGFVIEELCRPDYASLNLRKVMDCFIATYGIEAFDSVLNNDFDKCSSASEVTK